MIQNRKHSKATCSSLTEHLDVVEHRCRARRADAVVRPADVGPRVALAHRVDQQVAEQEAGVVMETQVVPILCPGDLRGGDATGDALQHQPLAFGHHDGAGRRRVDDPSGFRRGAWKRPRESRLKVLVNLLVIKLDLEHDEINHDAKSKHFHLRLERCLFVFFISCD